MSGALDILTRLDDLHARRHLRNQRMGFSDDDITLMLTEAAEEIRTLRRDIVVGNDALMGQIEALRARITDLEAQLEAIKNPPYRIITDIILLGNLVGNDCGWSVLRGNEFVMEQWGYDTEAEAREAAEQFIARLTAPFKSKD